MAIVELIPVDDKLLQDAGIKFVAINEPNLFFPCNGNGNVELDITQNWKDEGIKQLKERGKEHNLPDETISNLGSYIGNKVYVEKADIIAQILTRKTSSSTQTNTNTTTTPRAVTSSPIDSRIVNNDYFEYLINCGKKTVKEEGALVRKIFYTKLSAYSNDPINLGVLAPTSTGKTYPIIEAAKFTPLGREVRIVGSMTPKVLIREQGVLVDKERNPIAKEVRSLKTAIMKAKSEKKFDQVEGYQEKLAALIKDSAYLLDLSNTTLLFLEPPNPELWNLIKPILSHDHWEMEHPFVDKIASGGLEVKKVITQGWPACIFCSAKDESKWEMWPEIESRFMIESPNMVKPKYQAGNKLIAQKKGLPNAVKQQIIISDSEKELGKQCFLHLKNQIQQYTNKTDSPVWIPYGERLSEILPSDKGQDNRAANRFYTILNIIALTKAHLRHKLIYGDEELVIATLEDLREALHVMQNMTGLPPHKLRFYNQYILPLYKAKDSQKLDTKKICEFYNRSSPKGTQPMNSDNLRKNYLQELVSRNYLEQEQDESTKATKYLYTPLVNVDDEGEEEKDGGESNNNTEDSQQKRLTTSPTLEPVFEILQYSKLMLPENHKGIPKNWLNNEILQLCKRLPSSDLMKFLNPDGQEITQERFIMQYEPSKTGLKLQDFFTKPSLVGDSKSVKIITSATLEQYNDEKNTTNNPQEYEKSKTQSKVGLVAEVQQQEQAFWEIYGQLESQKEPESQEYIVTESILRERLIASGKFDAGDARQTINDLIQKSELTRLEYDVLSRNSNK